MTVGRGSRERHYLYASGGQQSQNKEVGTNLLLPVILKAVHHRPVGGLSEAALNARLLIGLKALAEALGAIVESITKRLMGGLQNVSACHENLQKLEMSVGTIQHGTTASTPFQGRSLPSPQDHHGKKPRP